MKYRETLFRSGSIDEDRPMNNIKRKLNALLCSGILKKELSNDSDFLLARFT
jgi:hypothetical protein